MAGLAVILNRASGSAGSEPARRIGARLERLGQPAILRDASPEGFASTVKAARDEGFDTIAVAGGDGSIRAAAAVLAGSDVNLGIVPLGTANLLARDLDIPTEIEGAVDLLVSGHPRAIDLGHVNGDLFLIHAVVGRLVAPVQLRERRRSRRSPLTWLYVAWVIIQALWRYPKRRYVIDVDGRVERLDAQFLATAVNRVTGQVGNPLHRTTLDAGHLALYAFPVAGTAAAKARAWPPTLPSGLADLFHVLDAETLLIRTRRRRLHVALDGEMHTLATPLSFRVEPEALKIIVPAERVGAS